MAVTVNHVFELPRVMLPLLEPAPFKVTYSGRHGAKSTSIAIALLMLGKQNPLTIVCARETMTSIRDSVHKLLSDWIKRLGYDDFYQVLKTEIKGRNGTNFTFRGVRQDILAIKSAEGIDILWMEEATKLTREQWQILMFTLRRPGCELWISFNPDSAEDDTWKMFVEQPPLGSVVIHSGYQDCPTIDDQTKANIDYTRKNFPDDYANIWEGQPRAMSSGAIYAKELVLADAQQRITHVPYNAQLPVTAYWDVGAVYMAIWLVQTVGLEFHVIDYIEGALQSLDYYLKTLKSKPYVCDKCVLPYDASQSQAIAAGRSIDDLVRAAGFQTKVLGKQTSIANGITATRVILSRCVFDSENCKDGLTALRRYSWEPDVVNSTASETLFKQTPKHDVYSHAADAFRYFAISVKEPASVIQKPTSPPPRRQSMFPSTWQRV